MKGPDPALLNIFAAEQAEHVARMRAILEALSSANPIDVQALVDEFLRRAHTLKGAARAVGLAGTEDTVHRLEAEFAPFRHGGDLPEEARTGALRALDRIEDLLAGELRHDGADSATGTGGAAALPSAEPPSASASLVRMDAATLDSVLRVSSEVYAAAAGDVEAAQRLQSHANAAEDAARTFARLREQCSGYLLAHAGDPGFAAVSECLRFADQQLPALVTSARQARAAYDQNAWRMRRHIADLHRHASRARMSPAGELLGGFGPMVRSLAEEQGKEAAYRTDGLDVQADRVVLQALKDPIMHLLRNAVSHGIEGPSERLRKGKPARGTVRLSVESRGDRLMIRVEDDGAGIDTGAVRAEAKRRALAADNTADLLKVLFRPGFSTVRSVSSIAGRGMGLSVVKEVVSTLRGNVMLTAGAAGGTTVQITVPVSVATQHVLLVEEANQRFALPVSAVSTVSRRRREEVILVDGRTCIPVDDLPIPVGGLAELLGLTRETPKKSDPISGDGAITLVVLHVGSSPAAIAVDRILDDRDVLVRGTGLRDSEAGFSAGAIPLEDGSAAVLLDIEMALQRFTGSASAADERFAPRTEERLAPLILVVDDSITTRSVERSILEAHGYRVELAVDGQEGLEKTHAVHPDLIISDVAMPRMDGFELLQRLKGGKDTASIPVILVTSLESPEEQERGLSLGADAYIVKRKFDQREILATVRQIV